MKSEERLEVLKEILLTDERELANNLAKKLHNIEQRQQNLPDRVSPTIDEKLAHFVKEIPKTLGPVITETLEKEIKNSQDAVAEALYPILGRMVKKYVQNEIAVLNDSINKKIETALNWRMWFKSKKQREKIVAEAIKSTHHPKIEHLLVIEKDSGLLIGSYSAQEIMDQDMVSGMLTAIKAFVEDAFIDKEIQLEQISYDLYTIHLQNFTKYYIAAVISGVYDNQTKNKLENTLLSFAQHEIKKGDLEDSVKFTKKLNAYFNDESI